ncbi:hypothetical protein SADUNF_Sadunf11G0105700 [Salix dunnii]|uniref:Uncharacterized protein n=1 Tax=Salix dunnii TaxID=1413687 RepID=A0A835MXD0_9ROSI|nr:hypothetical protein SADUNF_Sadunf11G0105700 [Salix dunnii]
MCSSEICIVTFRSTMENQRFCILKLKETVTTLEFFTIPLTEMECQEMHSPKSIQHMFTPAMGRYVSVNEITSSRSDHKTLQDETLPTTHPSSPQLHAAQSHKHHRHVRVDKCSILSKSAAYLDLCLIFLRFLFNLLIRFFFH